MSQTAARRQQRAIPLDELESFAAKNLRKAQKKSLAIRREHGTRFNYYQFVVLERLIELNNVDGSVTGSVYEDLLGEMNSQRSWDTTFKSLESRDMIVTERDDHNKLTKTSLSAKAPQTRDELIEASGWQAVIGDHLSKRDTDLFRTRTGKSRMVRDLAYACGYEIDSTENGMIRNALNALERYGLLKVNYYSGSKLISSIRWYGLEGKLDSNGKPVNSDTTNDSADQFQEVLENLVSETTEVASNGTDSSSIEAKLDLLISSVNELNTNFQRVFNVQSN